MNSADMVTVFSLKDATIKSLCDALNEHILACRIAPPDEYGWSPYPRESAEIPKGFRWLIAFAIEGNSEGYYIHIGAIIPAKTATTPTEYVNFAHAKTYQSGHALAICREAQRFLNAAMWN